MNTGQIISGTAHILLILFALFGGTFRSTSDPVVVQDVAILSEEDFAALSAPSAPPEAAAEIEAPPAPEIGESAPETPAAEAAPETRAAPDPTPEPAPETTPEPVRPTPRAEVADQPPVLATPQPEAPAPEIAETPTPDPAPRVAPEPVAPPEPDTTVAEQVQESVAPDAVAEQTAETDEREATAPEAAATEIVTEAEEPARAPDASKRPRLRPDRPAPPTPEPETEVAERPAPEPTPEPAPEPEPEAPSAVEAALAEALGGSTTDASLALPVGPPLTGGEKDALRVAVQRCWVVDVGSQAANVTVVVGMDMDQSGRVVTNSLRMIEASGGDGAAAQTAFQAARRAILRCQGDGFPLPPEKYAQWKEIEMVFDPSGMRLR